MLTVDCDGLPVSEITARLRWPKSSTHALLLTMERRGYLARDPETPVLTG
ncbi:MAG: helix-turn-helix domain-containing protein [Chloroflexi bacterium]|nr:helix-turn-helix domain-containing protein [Chloroflexota bacterium]